jgi:hypothetical protein
MTISKCVTGWNCSLMGGALRNGDISYQPFHRPINEYSLIGRPISEYSLMEGIR